ncbi:MAG TPA: MerR family transcriptional regulator [Nannocystaceae bacterium]|nr:MerR family transcriptional regulator [Nannocystaceae bacterium]
MPNGRLTISELAERAGVSVRTLRFWSDEGLIPVASRSAAGYRLYDEAALARLQLVGTLRALGLGHEAITAILRGQRSVADVARTHAEAITAQLGVLRMQRSVLLAVARRSTDTKEMAMVHALATATAAERQRIVDDFAARICEGLPEEGPSRRIIDTMCRLPDALPDDPDDAHVDAWLELASLVADPSFVARVREMAEAGSAPRDPDAPTMPEHTAVLEQVGRARAAGIDPTSAEAQPVLAALGLAALDAATRSALRSRIATFFDARVERYWQLYGILHGNPPFSPVGPVYEWLIAALTHR